MAEATFTLRAVDSTRAAFASVQNSLTKIHSTAKTVSTGMAGFFGLRALVTVGKSVNAMLEDVEANSKKFGVASDELDRLTRVTGAVDSGMNFLKNSLVFVADKVLNLKDELLGTSRIESISIADKIRADRDAPKIEEVNKQIEELNRSLNSIGETPAEKFASLADQIQRINEEASKEGVSTILSSLEKEAATKKILIEQTAIASKSFEDYKDSVKEVENAFEDLKDKQLPVEKQQEKIVSKVIELTSAISDLQSILPENGLFDIGTATSEEIANLNEMTKLQKELASVVGKRVFLETNLQIISRKAGEMIASGFEDAIFSGQKLGEVIRSLGMDLMRMVFNQQITAPLAKGIGDALFAGFRAEGGPVGAGGAYMVGEKGPELFVPSSSGSIVPNGAMGSSGGSAGGVTVNYNIAAGVSRAELVPILEQERRRLKAEIPDMVRRGGGYRAAFA